MDNPSLNQIKLKYPLGQFVQGKVEHHAPFGVFVDLGEASVKGLIKIPDFLDQGVMREEMYPDLGTIIGAIVVGHNESSGREVYLNAKPSVLHQALVPLKSQVLAM
ncbi:MAG: RNA-binding protein [Drouetiella hepatica Uher 2000/2452]|jgi:ribosomal protein S1|uniref:RNA-binding protein n=1 Tax=Drouetiella hepatica Uher 2000/2452 TaxID=904376 RepID=A0A951UPV6_9CYAN|nr:RNA-binding protein [Drouetiella hepatica Uher 2000/2452]